MVDSKPTFYRVLQLIKQVFVFLQYKAKVIIGREYENLGSHKARYRLQR